MRSVLLAVLATLLILPAAASATEPPPGATWQEAYLPSTDGTVLHADVLRPAHLSPTTKTPVILTVSPYTNHGGDTTPDPTKSGPSHRFYDFLEHTQAIQRGYTYVIVDLRGTGGSAGCQDWGGPGEQADVKAAVEWAASEPWSTGRVAMLGKSYDGWTGLMGIANQPKGLAAVISMEPVYSGYRYLYSGGVRYSNSVLTPLLFDAISAMPGSPQDSPEYQVNASKGNIERPGCPLLSFLEQQEDRENALFWQARDLITKIGERRPSTPLFLTQGLLEANTKPDGAVDVLKAMQGPKYAWFGQFDHVRGWEDTGRDAAPFVRQLNRFLDRFLKQEGAGPETSATVQQFDGRWRQEDMWPPADAKRYGTRLWPGTYTDDRANSGTSGPGEGVWTISRPLGHAVQLSGEPVIMARAVTEAPRANFVANVYDIDADGHALMISRNATLLREPGEHQVRLKLYGQDWVVEKGHRIGVLLSGSNTDWWEHVPTGQDVAITRGAVSLPFLRAPRTHFVEDADAKSARLEEEQAGGFPVPAETIDAAGKRFDVP
ncbi:MAG TPA: CocE/NonD family hydrolase [Solirubrobacteraceae bacterium]|jgi:hypothetical protein